MAVRPRPLADAVLKNEDLRTSPSMPELDPPARPTGNASNERDKRR
jgi:hypothetical protein